MDTSDLIETIDAREEAPEQDYCVRVIAHCRLNYHLYPEYIKTMERAQEAARLQHPDLAEELFARAPDQVEVQQCRHFLGSVVLTGTVPEVIGARDLIRERALAQLRGSSEVEVQIVGSDEVIPCSKIDVEPQQMDLLSWRGDTLNERIELDAADEAC